MSALQGLNVQLATGAGRVGPQWISRCKLSVDDASDSVRAMACDLGIQFRPLACVIISLSFPGFVGLDLSAIGLVWFQRSRNACCCLAERNDSRDVADPLGVDGMVPSPENTDIPAFQALQTVDSRSLADVDNLVELVGFGLANLVAFCRMEYRRGCADATGCTLEKSAMGRCGMDSCSTCGVGYRHYPVGVGGLSGSEYSGSECLIPVGGRDGFGDDLCFHFLSRALETHRGWSIYAAGVDLVSLHFACWRINVMDRLSST